MKCKFCGKAIYQPSIGAPGFIHVDTLSKTCVFTAMPEEVVVEEKPIGLPKISFRIKSSRGTGWMYSPVIYDITHVFEGMIGWDWRDEARNAPKPWILETHVAGSQDERGAQIWTEVGELIGQS